MLRGYMLEEVLAYLVKKSGFNLLVDASQDRNNLAMKRGDLVVRGRGKYHQANVLGQLEWTPAFTYPLRLFVEAKFRKDPIGIDVVRNAISILLDVNQKSTLNEEDILLQKYHYVYALFSTSGFTEDSVYMGLAHQISLIDLNSSDYSVLLESIRTAARNIKGDIDNMDNIVYNLRYILRRKLRTLPIRIEYYGGRMNDHEQIEELLGNMIKTTENYGELFIGMPNIPFMILLKPEKRDEFIRYLERKPNHKINITWSHHIDKRRTWTIRPSESPEEYKLTFKLPSVLAKRIFGTIDEGIYERALSAKEKYFSHIIIYRKVQRQIQWYKLNYDRDETLKYLENS